MEEGLVLSDTNIIIDFYKEDAKVLSNLQLIGQKNIAISAITVGELFHGALNKNELARLINDMNHLNIIHADLKTSELFLQLMAAYSLSHRLSVPDGLIAATALSKSLTLYTHNLRDFRYIKEIVLFDEQ